VNHRVDGLCRLQELSLHGTAVDLGGHGLAEVTAGDRSDHPGHLARGPDQVLDQLVHRVDRFCPLAAESGYRRPLGDPSLLADQPPHPGELVAETLVSLDHLVDGVGDLARDAAPAVRDPDAEVASLELRHHPQEDRLVELLRVTGCGAHSSPFSWFCYLSLRLSRFLTFGGVDEG